MGSCKFGPALRRNMGTVFMRAILLDLLVLPMPILWLLLLGVALWRWSRPSRASMLGATLLLLALSLPATGKILAVYLIQGARPADSYVGEGQASGAAPIVLVPTAGTFDDGSGRWWATENSILRATAGRRLQARLGGPLKEFGVPSHCDLNGVTEGTANDANAIPAGRWPSGVVRSVAPLGY